MSSISSSSSVSLPSIVASTSSLTSSSSSSSTTTTVTQSESQVRFTIDPRVVRRRLEGGQVSSSEQKTPAKIQATHQ